MTIEMHGGHFGIYPADRFMSTRRIDKDEGMLPIDTLLYNTTRTIPGGSKYYDYPMAFKVPLWSKTKLNS